MKTGQNILKALAAGLALAGCATGVTVSQSDVSYGYSPSELSVVGSGGNQLRTIVIGNPFAMTQAAFAAAAIQSMQGNSFGTPVTFALHPVKQDTARNHRVVIAFNPATLRHPGGLCTTPSDAPTTPARGGALTVMGAYCQGAQFLSHATARGAGITGPGTAQFDFLMSQLTLALFPAENPHTRPERSSCRDGIC